jgi:hypothetical protein
LIARETFKVKGGEVMRRQSIAIAGMMILTLVLAIAAMAADPFVGTWKLNVAKSKLTDPIAMPKSEISKWEGSGNGMKATVNGVDAEGNAYQIEVSAKYDGRDYPMKGYPLADTVSEKKIDANTLEMVAKKAGKEIERWRLTVSKDGKTQTWTGKGINSKGQAYTGTFIYDKQ